MTTGSGLNRKLEAEGYAREISRKVQALRKKSGLVKADKIKLGIFVEENLKKLIESQMNFLKERVNAVELKMISIKDSKEYREVSEEKIKGKIIKIMFNRI